jgi:hypothetical protein
VHPAPEDAWLLVNWRTHIGNWEYAMADLKVLEQRIAALELKMRVLAPIGRVPGPHRKCVDQATSLATMQIQLMKILKSRSSGPVDGSSASHT